MSSKRKSGGQSSPFARVVGVPTGGWLFAAALQTHVSDQQGAGLLVAEDVWTTGGSVRRFLASASVPGPFVYGWDRCVCVFARGETPGWVLPLFRFAGEGE